MSDYIVNITLAPYLAQWFAHLMQQVPPYRLSRNSLEYYILQSNLRKPRATDVMKPGTQGNVAIRIPDFKEIDIETYNVLTDEGIESLRTAIYNRFRIQLFDDLVWIIKMNLHLGTRHIQSQKQKCVMDWMQKNGIDVDETNYRSVLKVFDRLRKSYMQAQHRSMYPKKKRAS